MIVRNFQKLFSLFYGNEILGFFLQNSFHHVKETTYVCSSSVIHLMLHYVTYALILQKAMKYLPVFRPLYFNLVVQFNFDEQV